MRGEYKRRQRESATFDWPGRGKGSYSIATTVEAHLEAHVGDDAYAKDYEYRGTIAFEVRSTDDQGRRLPTRVFRVRFSNLGLDPRKGWQNAFGAGSKAEAEGFGPRGRVTGKEFELAALTWSLSDLLLQDKARAQLLEVEKRWRDGRCVEVDGGPDGRVVDTGGSIRVGAVARSTQDGQAIQPSDVSADVCTKFYEGGTVSPSRASNPGSFNYSDPGRTWKPDKNDWDPPCLSFKSVSRRGIGTGNTTFKVRDTHYFRATLAVKDEFGWSKSYESVIGEGTDSECRTSGSGNGTWSAAVVPKPGSSRADLAYRRSTSRNR